LRATATKKRDSLVSRVMAEPPASGCATRGAGFDGASFEGVSEELLLEELGSCALAGMTDALRNSEAARHRENSAGHRKDDLAGEDTIRIRRSREV
jgi:hypothetical protein